jgi:2-polyprenyl-3-methyl-5-hydroxy-6-metoxy-1,4-benzoquinol methylase
LRIFREYYDKEYFSSLLYKQKFGSQRNFLRLRTIRKLKKKGVLLDVGCGEGHFIEIAGKYYQAEGIDVSDYAVGSAVSKGHQARVADISKTKLPQKSYDIISVFNILEHITNPHQSVENLYNALKNEGILIGSVPNNYGLIGSLSTRLSNFFDRTHQFTPSPQTWQTLFERSGFARINLMGEFTFTKNNSRYLNFNGWPHFSINLVFICHKD